MMENRGNRKSGAEPPDDEQRRKRRRVLIGVLVVVVGAALLGAGLFWCYRIWFVRNPRFTLFQVELKSSGYWQEHPEELQRELGLQVGRDNLFELKLGELRDRLQAIPNVRNCEVVRILPDTLRIRISERIPRLALGSPGSDWVVDEDAVVLQRSRAMNIPTQLPIASGVKVPPGGLQPGQRLEQLTPALDVLMKIVRNFSDFNLLWLSVGNPDQLELLIRYRNRRSYQVKLPPKSQNYNFLLTNLQQAIINAESSGERRSRFNLLFDGALIVQ